MTNNPRLQDILFIDIETVAITDNYNLLDERLKVQWSKKAAFLKHQEDQSDEGIFNERAGIYAEFGKIIVIGLGFFHQHDTGELGMRIKSIHGHEEIAVLQKFLLVLEKFDQQKILLCGHNGKEFDFPYLCRRLLINGLTLPPVLDSSGKKPWEVNHLDTMELWKFGDRKNFTSLDLLGAIFDIESSKTGIDGSMVNEVYYKEGNLEKIAQYCMQDVVVTAQLYLKMKGLQTVKKENITFTDQ